MSQVVRKGDLEGLPEMIAGLIEGNLKAEPARARLLEGGERRVLITASDLDTNVALLIGNGAVTVSTASDAEPDMVIIADAETLIELPNAKLLFGLPSISDPIGRKIVAKLLSGRVKIKGIYKVGLLAKVQRLLTVA